MTITVLNIENKSGCYEKKKSSRLNLNVFIVWPPKLNISQDFEILIKFMYDVIDKKSGMMDDI